MDNAPTIQSPEEVTRLMRELYYGHKAGLQLSRNNVFMVGLPLPTEKELEDARIMFEERDRLREEKLRNNNRYNQ